jgi:hypothetical protein
VLIFEHVLCRSGDLARINAAFFQMNTLVGLLLVLGVAASIYLPDARAWYVTLRLYYPGGSH